MMKRNATVAAIVLTIPALGGALPSTALGEEPPCPFYENRSGLCGYYHSEISPAEAFLNTVVKRGRWSRPSLRAVILDVRSTPEYKAGHPEHSLNVPYPYIYQYCEDDRLPDGACKKVLLDENKQPVQIPQDDADFVKYVERIIPNKDTPIYTLCRTGVRSVGAANLLTDAGYTHVRNIWEGYVGVNLTAPKKQADGSVKTLPVDLNHDGVLNDQDKNGWRYHQGLPYDTRLLPNLIYRNRMYPDIYSWD
ncbi:MAG: rhodanese-like domain-containing protein [Chromatiaceae bacterium]|nr:rhodanese-like domain-containing protein [Chromatiaceae bacterium]